MANAITSQGFVFEIGNGDSPLTYTEVKEVASFSGFDGAPSEEDITHLGSVAKEFMVGLQDEGSFSLDINYLTDDAGQSLMRTARNNSTLQDFRASLSNGVVFTFQGYVISAPMSGSVDEKVSGSFGIKITGAVAQA